MSNFYNQASWVLVPSGIEEDIVFAQKPISGLGDLTFTRASDATYTDASGVVRRSPYNLLTFSEDFSNVAWQKLASSISSNVTIAPNGTLTADKLVEDTTNATHQAFQSTSISASTSYNYSVYLKAAERFRFRVRFAGQSGAQDSNVDLNAGTASAGTLTSVGNGWFRLILSVNSGTGANSTFVSIALQDASGNTTYLGNGTGGAFIWCAQLVEGTSALDYFPTTNRQDVPRIDFRNADGTLSSCGRLLLEPQRTNSIRNSSMVGAVAGTPGTLPTNWSISNLGTLTRTVVGTGTENGLPYIDYRIQGTALNTTIQFAPEPTTQIAAANGQVWASSYYLKSVAGTIPDQVLRISQLNSGGTNLATNTQSIVVDGTLKRYSYAFTLNQATTAFVFTCVQLTTTVGATYDFTIRIAAPQMELGAYATTWVPTTTAAVTRLADTASKTGVSSLIGQTEGTIFLQTTFTALSANRDFIYLGDASNSFRIVGTAGNAIAAGIRTASTTVNFVTTGALTTGTYKIAYAYKSGDIALYINGAQIGTSTSTSMPVGTLSVLNLGNPVFNTRGIEEPVSQSAIFPTRLTNAELAQLTTL